jgi:DNA polymerase (family X)
VSEQRRTAAGRQKSEVRSQSADLFFSGTQQPFKTKSEASAKLTLSLLQIFDSRNDLGMNNQELAKRFYQLSALMEIRGDDPFRLLSYRNAAEAIETWPTPMSEILQQEGTAGLQSIPGVGKAIGAKIVDLLNHGTFDAWEKLTKETPATVLELLEVPGIGPKTAAQLHQKFKVSSLLEFKQFVKGGGLGMVDGIGPKTAEKIKESLL